MGLGGRGRERLSEKELVWFSEKNNIMAYCPIVNVLENCKRKFWSQLLVVSRMMFRHVNDVHGMLHLLEWMHVKYLCDHYSVYTLLRGFRS